MKALALGTAQFGQRYGIANRQGQVSRHDARAIVAFASGNGMDTIDTAINYGDSELRLGELGIQGWRVVSKLPSVPADHPDLARWTRESVDESLARLRVSSLYGLLLHQPRQLLEQNGDHLYLALQQLKLDRRVQKIGVSVYDPAELDELVRRYDFDIVQAPFNVLDRRLIDSGWLSRLETKGIEVHTRSVFLQGLLLMTASTRPPEFDCWASIWTKWDAWLKQTGLTPLEACLRYALSFSQISRIVIGIDSLEQLKDNLVAASGTLPEIPDNLRSNDPDLLDPTHWVAP